MTEQQTPRAQVLDLFGKNMADHFDMAARFPEDDRPGILDILYTQINGWISFFRGDEETQLYVEDGEFDDLVELMKEPDVLKTCLEEFRDTFDEANENDRVVADFIKKYACKEDEDRLRESMKTLTGINLWDGERLFDLEEEEV